MYICLFLFFAPFFNIYFVGGGVDLWLDGMTVGTSLLCLVLSFS